MKLLLLLLLLTLLTFSASANFVKESDLDAKLLNCDFPMVSYAKKKSCGVDCVKIDKNFKCETHVKIDEMIDDRTKPVNSKNEINNCGEYCESVFEETACIDPLEKRVLNLELEQIYCTKFLRFEQKLSGNKIVSENATKKATHEAEKQAKSDAKVLKKANVDALKNKLKTGDLNLVEINEFLRNF